NETSTSSGQPRSNIHRRVPPLAWSIGELALRVDQPAYVLFGLDAMYQALAEMGDDSQYREFIAHTGAFDPFGVLFDIPLNRNPATFSFFLTSPMTHAPAPMIASSPMTIGRPFAPFLTTAPVPRKTRRPSVTQPARWTPGDSVLKSPMLASCDIVQPTLTCTC